MDPFANLQAAAIKSSAARPSVKSLAFKQSMLLAQELDDHWSILRRRERNNRIARVFGSEVVSSSALNSEEAKGPKLTEGLEVYLRLKGLGRPDTFHSGALGVVKWAREQCCIKKLPSDVDLNNNP